MAPSKKIAENANKIAFLVGQYPEKTMPEIINLFQLPAIDTNTAIWYAVEKRFITDMDPNTKFCKLLERPEKWEFGQNVEDLEAALLYSFQKLGREEKDLEENYMGNWTMGYIAHDVLVAMKDLLERKVLHEYEIEDGENAYIFYTLYENRDKVWGQKQFKDNPLNSEKPDEQREKAEE